MEVNVRRGEMNEVLKNSYRIQIKNCLGCYCCCCFLSMSEDSASISSRTSFHRFTIEWRKDDLR